VRLAHHFALENSLIQADCIEATEFPDLAGRYRVFAVPKIVINDKASFEGALPEEFFVDEVMKAVAPQREPGEAQA
jgi:Thioredoxin domain